MLIIKIMGGFASQVYKFFLGAKLAEYLQTELVLDVSDYYDGYFRPYNLNMLNLPAFRTVCTREIAKKYPGLNWIRNTEDMENMISGRLKGDFYIFREEPDYADFFWKHPEFEVDENTPYIKSLALKKTSLFIETFKRNIAGQTSVAIHIRRGDFVTLGQESKIFYYRAAIAWFYERDPQTEFYFFSNDLVWVKEQFGTCNQFHYVCSKDEKAGDIEELFCMSYCNYRVLSNYSGYGLLANTFSAVRNTNGFALIEERMNHEYEYKGIEGSIKYLNQEQIKEYDFKYKNIDWGKCESVLSQQDMKTPEQKEKVSRKEKFYMITCEKYSKWFRRGMFEIAIKLTENGYETKYINLHNCSRQKQLDSEAACNMDGQEYGFDILSGSLTQIERLLQENPDAFLVCDCKLPFRYAGQSILIKSKKAYAWQKKWTKELLRDNFKDGIRYLLYKSYDFQHIVTLLDKYWEHTLMQDGKSDEDVTTKFHQIYKEIVDQICLYIK